MKANSVVAIHQPNFLPWLGYFNKVEEADIFVALDSVQFQKTGGTWCNRVRIVINGQPAWITMPIDRSYSGLRSIREIRIADTSWRQTMLRTIRMAYTRASHFDEVFPVVSKLIGDSTRWLTEFNLACIKTLGTAIGLDADKIVLSSTLSVQGNATDLLIDIVKAVGGVAYLAGRGAGGYQEDGKFGAAGIELRFQDFVHPQYPQCGIAEFLPGLSIVDALMNCGFEKTHELIRAKAGSIRSNSPRRLGAPGQQASGAAR